MSTTENTRILEDAQADFDTFISRRNWGDAKALLDNLWEMGFHAEAITLGKRLVAAKMNVNNDDKIRAIHESFADDLEESEESDEVPDVRDSFIYD